MRTTVVAAAGPHHAAADIRHRGGRTRLDARGVAWLEASASNASSVHGAGQAARRLLEDARDLVAQLIGCESIEVVFTSGGTESVNLALQGLWQARADGRDALVLPTASTTRRSTPRHGCRARARSSVRACRRRRAHRRRRVHGRAAARGSATALVVNNEVGTVQDAAELAAAASEADVPLHLDAVGAVGHLPVSFRAWRGGRGGARGAERLRSQVRGAGRDGVPRRVAVRAPRPVLHGGGQQRGLRSGSPDVAGAAALRLRSTRRRRNWRQRRRG
jgi:cysteine desulfurase